MIEVNTTDRGFSPTVDWMVQRYNEMNELLFHGELGYCDFDIFTKGKGSQGRTLGWFRMQNRVKANSYSRRMYIERNYYPYYDEVNVNSSNFADICRPLIELNGNYTGTEYGFLAVLVHEMCHYYTYMNGRAPKQGHGPEFRHIGMVVSHRSGNLFTIERLVTAEDMSHLDLNDKMKEKNDRRIENKKAKVNAVFQFNRDGSVRLTTTSSQTVINQICKFSGRPNVKEVVITNDTDIIETLFKKGYRINMRTWRYWDIKSETDILQMLSDTSNKQVIPNPEFVAESRKRRSSEIINEVINDFIRRKTEDDSITITPEMDLGAYSPFELV